ncbi:bifunctional oligoribonuclease/PAP phosphatase NrnA [Soehngenia saccharolytica]|nr:bifunctional oligoribonuclease/PAP phosphatase NrnA [Soehngenia saccharolytica]
MMGILKMNNSMKLSLSTEISKSNNVGIVSHLNPDGDNIGSILALGISLEKLGKTVTILKSDYVPNDLLFLPYVNKIIKVEDDLKFDILFVLDSSDPERLGDNKRYLSNSGIVVNIDHHISNTNFGNINIVDSKASSTSEIIFKLIEELELPLDENVATCIYAGISTDTGRFMYENVTSSTHIIVSKLLDTGIDAYYINKKLYQNRSLERTKLFIEVVGTTKLLCDNKVSIAKVTLENLSKTNAKPEDSDGIVEFLRDTETVEVSVLLKEITTSLTRVSIRTKDYVDANKICSHFGGGGHLRAAGCTIEKSIDESENLIIEVIKNYI